MAYVAFKVRVQLSLVQLFCTIHHLVVKEGSAIAIQKITFTGMYDAAPGNYWFGKKWYYTLTDPTPKCPENLTRDGHKFINLLDGEKYVDEGLKIECVDEAQSS